MSRVLSRGLRVLDNSTTRGPFLKNIFPRVKNGIMPKSVVEHFHKVFAWHSHSVEECMHAAESLSMETGLSSEEAGRRLVSQGKNAMTPPERPSFLRKLWAQINSALIWILLAATIISGAQKEWAEFGLILAVYVP